MRVHGLLSTADAAGRLRIHPSRVRALLAAGELDGFKVGERWVVEADSIRHRMGSPAVSGRLLEPANAWAVLCLASGEPVPQLTPDARWRLRKLLNEHGLAGLSPRLRRRARRERYRAHPGVLRQLSERPEVMRSGISAASSHALDLASGNELDVYISHANRNRLVGAYALEPAGVEGNVSLRIVTAGQWLFNDARRVAPLAAVALDLAQEADARSSRVGQEALAALDRQGMWRVRAEGSTVAPKSS